MYKTCTSVFCVSFEQQLFERLRCLVSLLFSSSETEFSHLFITKPSLSMTIFGH